MPRDVAGRRGGFKSDIDVTALAAVVLVLLVNMMLITPIVDPGVAVTLPEASHSADKRDSDDQTVVAVDSRGYFYVNALPVAHDDLGPRVRKVLTDSRDRLVYVKGDRDAKYAAIMRAMEALRGADVDDIVLVTERPPGVGARR